MLTAASLLGSCSDQLVAVSPTPAALHLRPIASDAPFAINVGETLPLEALLVP
jgi:hypothetical protein